MPKFISIKEAMKQGSGKVAVRGWVYRERGSNKLKFIVMRDSSGIIQCIIEKSKVGDALFNQADKLRVETSLTLVGKIKEDKRAPTGYEITVDTFDVVGECDTFPITKDLVAASIASVVGGNLLCGLIVFKPVFCAAFNFASVSKP